LLVAKSQRFASIAEIVLNSAILFAGPDFWQIIQVTRMLRTPLAAALVVDAGNWIKMPQDNPQGNQDNRYQCIQDPGRRGNKKASNKIASGYLHAGHQ
jgi:hypothetical protein